MALSIVHNKVDQVADWTQADLDTQIALGNFAPGTVLADIVLSSDWNDAHQITGTLPASDVEVTPTTTLIDTDVQAALETLGINLRDIAFIDMGGADYTATLAEAKAQGKVIVNGGTGKKLMIPTSSDGQCPTMQIIVMAFTSDPIEIYSETYGISGSVTISAPEVDVIGYGTIGGIVSLYNSSVSNSAYGAGWNGSLKAPTQNAVYDALSTLSPPSSVTVSCDFGASFNDKAQTVVTGQTWVAADSEIVAQVKTGSGVDPDEMYLLNIRPVISDLVAGDGFTVTLYSEPEAKGTYSVMCIGV